MDKKEKVFNFLKTQIHGTIATVNAEGNPESAWVGFGEAPDLSLIFGTDSTSRKYQNILQNPNVAFTFSTDLITVQYEGEICHLEGDELQKYKELYWVKVPEAKKYENEPNQVYLKVKPHWIRWTSFEKKIEIFEITF